jgi:hypothetical protein
MTHPICGHLEQRSEMRAASGDQHVVDSVRRPVEESLQRRCIVGVEGGRALRVDLACRSLERVGIAAGEDDVGTFGASMSRGFETDAGAAADHDEGLPGQ